MRPTAREIAKTLLVGAVVMIALPGAYRLWTIYHPQPVRPRTTLAQYLEKSTAANEVRLLVTPLAQWSDREKLAKPAICAWLKAHERTVLPWEWTDEAKRKDPDGYRKLWRRVFEERSRELESALGSERKRLKALGREIEILETVHSHRTNQLAKIESSAVTNSFPMVLEVARMEKGRFWGWNTRTELLTFADRDAFDSPERGWTAVERREASAEADRIGAKAGERRSVEEKAARLQALADKAEGVLASLSKPPVASSDALAAELISLLSE